MTSRKAKSTKVHVHKTHTKWHQMIKGQSQAVATRNWKTISWRRSNFMTFCLSVCLSVCRSRAIQSSTPLARRDYGTLMNQLFIMKGKLDRAENVLCNVRRVWAKRLASHVVPFSLILWNQPRKVKALVLKWEITKVWKRKQWGLRTARLTVLVLWHGPLTE